MVQYNNILFFIDKINYCLLIIFFIFFLKNSYNLNKTIDLKKNINKKQQNFIK